MMDHFVRFVLVLFVVVLVTGCTTVASTSQESQSAAQVAVQVAVVETDEQLGDCAFVTTVAFDPPFTLLTQLYPETAFMTRDDVRKQLRREAAYAGGDTVLPSGVQAGKVHGKAYECGEG